MSLKAEKKSKIIRLVILFLVMIVYGYCFTTIHMSLGNGAFVVMNVFPVVAGLLFGMTMGGVIGIVTILLVIFLGSSIHLDFPTFMPTITVSSIVMLSLGVGVGRLCDLSVAIKKELNKRQKIEATLRDSQNDLELRVKERTFELEQATIELKKEVSERIQAQEVQQKLQSQLNQTQKMDSVGRLAGGVAHDFNNMLGVILGNVEMLMDDLTPTQPTYVELKEIKKAAKRSANLTRQLLAFASKQAVKPQVVDLNPAIEGMLKMLQHLIGENINLVWLPGQNLESIYIDPSQIDQTLVNLFVNARDAIANVGKITIETGNAIFDEDYCKKNAGFIPGEFVLLAVGDDGLGMGQETISQIFDPFFTTKEHGKGTGLGLSIIYGIATQNNGFINVTSEAGKGTIFEIYLPKFVGKHEMVIDQNLINPDRLGHEIILLVEDEPAILRMTKMMLEKLGYTVITAVTPREAIQIVQESCSQIHLLMTDVVMPEMNGREMAKIILSSCPDIKCLFMSGYTADVIAQHGVLDKGVHFLQKPISKKDLSIKIREVIGMG